MSYNPHHYKHLFPKGLFNYPNENLVNWNESHQLFALNAIPRSFKEKRVAPGLVLKTGHIKQPPGFSNYLIFEIDPKLRDIQVRYFPRMIYPFNAFKKLGSPLALANLGYFYLTDEEKLDPVKAPKVRTMNLVVTGGKIVALPVFNRSAFISLKDKSLALAFVQARGNVRIGGKVYSWVGSKTMVPKADKVVVYNSSNINIIRTIDPIMGPTRTVREDFVKPEKNHQLLITSVRSGIIKVIKITEVPVAINNLDMVLSVPKSVSVSNGDAVTFETIDQFSFNQIQSAVTAGPMIFRDETKRIKQVLLEGFDEDTTMTASTHSEGYKLARGCLVLLPSGQLALVAIDGIPQAGEIYPGVTPAELSDFVRKHYPNYKAAICTDPSSTMKVIYRINGEVEVFGNRHYLHHKKLANGVTKFWPSDKLGRKINSALVIN